MQNKSLILVIVALSSLIAKAHEHHNQPGPPQKSQDIETEKIIFKKIDLDYRKSINDIFKNKCMDCHSSKTQYPFYATWPLAKKIINDDVVEARKHMKFDDDFPFVGHGSPKEDLEAIERVSTEGTMPPFRYRIFHWGSGLSNTEKESISKWVKEGLRSLENKPN